MQDHVGVGDAPDDQEHRDHDHARADPRRRARRARRGASSWVRRSYDQPRKPKTPRNARPVSPMTTELAARRGEEHDPTEQPELRERPEVLRLDPERFRQRDREHDDQDEGQHFRRRSSASSTTDAARRSARRRRARRWRTLRGRGGDPTTNRRGRATVGRRARDPRERDRQRITAGVAQRERSGLLPDDGLPGREDHDREQERAVAPTGRRPAASPTRRRMTIR